MKLIKLTKGFWAKVDDSDYASISKFKWYAAKGGRTYYAQRTVRDKKKNGGDGRGHTLKMDKFIMKTPNGLFCDHKDGDGLNNQRDNLRICTKKDNTRNRKRVTTTRSKYKGVYQVSSNKKRWYASIGFEGKNLYLGAFDNKKDAAITYNKKAIELFGEFAAVNIINK